MIEKKFGAFSSSSDPQKLGDTVKAAVLGVSVVAIYLAKLVFDVELSPTDVSEFATMLGGAVAAIGLAYGAIKKVVVWAIVRFHVNRA